MLVGILLTVSVVTGQGYASAWFHAPSLIHLTVPKEYFFAGHKLSWKFHIKEEQIILNS